MYTGKLYLPPQGKYVMNKIKKMSVKKFQNIFDICSSKNIEFILPDSNIRLPWSVFSKFSLKLTWFSFLSNEQLADWNIRSHIMTSVHRVLNTRILECCDAWSCHRTAAKIPAFKVSNYTLSKRNKEKSI